MIYVILLESKDKHQLEIKTKAETKKEAIENTFIKIKNLKYEKFKYKVINVVKK
jgi:hypothetical protein